MGRTISRRFDGRSRGTATRLPFACRVGLMDSWMSKTDFSSAVRTPRWWIANLAIYFVIVDLLRSQSS
jgi:hypothetical protein